MDICDIGVDDQFCYRPIRGSALVHIIRMCFYTFMCLHSPHWVGSIVYVASVNGILRYACMYVWCTSYANTKTCTFSIKQSFSDFPCSYFLELKHYSSIYKLNINLKTKLCCIFLISDCKLTGLKSFAKSW